MPPERSSFVNVDELMPQISLQQVADFYGVHLPELHRTSAETRTRCFLNCGKENETGPRVLAIQENSPVKTFKCHNYGCGCSGNLVSICDLVKPGENAGGRPRGERFREIARDLQAMAGGVQAGNRPSIPPAPIRPPVEVQTPEVNVPLAQSPNERARPLVSLDTKFVRDLAAMPQSASAYMRRRPFLTPEVLSAWRVGYLPRHAGGDTTGGTMRGSVVYPYASADGELLTWFGRDPDYEAKLRQWQATDRTGREPEKFHFVKGFHRGLELFGQERLKRPDVLDMLMKFGVILCEGPNDVIRLGTLGVPAVGLCSNMITREQAAKAAALAHQFAGGIVTVFLDCDPEGENGAKRSLGYLAQLVPVRLAWTSSMYGGKYKNRQPESLTEQEWAEIAAFLTRQVPAADVPRLGSSPQPTARTEDVENPFEFI